ncbi:MAG: glycosyltransferase [Proteobacteria bacterium]|nr:glycosyltransferase [Pseudomonadota bacterium]
MPIPSLALTWALSTVSGYGIYGLHIALEYFRMGGEQLIFTHESGPVAVPALTQMRIAPVLDLATKLSTFMKSNPHETLAFTHPVLHAVGNDCKGYVGQDHVRGTHNIGCAAIEHPAFSSEAMDYARTYDAFIAISKWNEAFLKSLNIAPVHLCYQGIDTTLFMPGPKTGLWKNRFIVFSGGKFEFRKGQDIIATAFKRFHERHPEALLVTSWQSPMPLDPRPFQLAGHCQTLPRYHETRGLQIAPWLLELGLPAGSFVELPFIPNMLMPTVLRECDAAIFPNRCEGGTNLVAMEAMACGVPTIVAYNTGQKDLVDLLGVKAFTSQKDVETPADFGVTTGWGETDPDEVVAALEEIYTHRQEQQQQAAVIAQKIKAWDWGPQNHKLLETVFA